MYSTVKTGAPAVTVTNLKPATRYVFQIRAASPGPSWEAQSFNPSIEVQTPGEGKWCAPPGGCWMQAASREGRQATEPPTLCIYTVKQFEIHLQPPTGNLPCTLQRPRGRFLGGYIFSGTASFLGFSRSPFWTLLDPSSCSSFCRDKDPSWGTVPSSPPPGFACEASFPEGKGTWKGAIKVSPAHFKWSE